ncbi:MAG TPA: hypothetical protein VM434_10950 [Beijerinckiaceae bacterium]|nr:hypothetical protein [Beijerinckiaceae bacterium]
MPILDARALDTDPDGTALLKAVLGSGRKRPKPGAFDPAAYRKRMAGRPEDAPRERAAVAAAE